MNAQSAQDMRLNAICPYFTMFPLEFPLGVLSRRGTRNGPVLDPFCGRGTTNFAARVHGIPTVGIDAVPVAAAATEAKLAFVTPREIVDAAHEILKRREPVDIPNSEFWNFAYRPDVLEDICRLRNALAQGEVTGQRAAALRGVMLGALHGPVGRTKQSYFSNQSPRTFGPKPAYAVRFWKRRGLKPPRANVLQIIAERAHRYYSYRLPKILGAAVCGDSRCASTVDRACTSVGGIDWIVTSPPYLGLRTYQPDQWIRNWFLGGPPYVDYSSSGQLSNGSVAEFQGNLRQVWQNVGRNCNSGATLVVRFGAIGSRPVDEPRDIIRGSLRRTNWVVKKVDTAHTAARGRRQMDTFNRDAKAPLEEFDVWASWER